MNETGKNIGWIYYKTIHVQGYLISVFSDVPFNLAVLPSSDFDYNDTPHCNPFVGFLHEQCVEWG